MTARFGKDGSSPLRYGTYIGIVKKNNDSQGMGRCSVWIPDFGGEPTRESSWLTVSYAAPFAGATSIADNKKDSGEQSGSQTSYGFWMQAPDLDNRVLVTFANGNTAHGFWFACIYDQNMNHSVPTVASNISTDDGLTQQGILPPVVEYNKKSSLNPDNPQRPTFDPLHNGLTTQGLYTDKERGPATGGARRESPSKAFGYSTPRGTSVMVDDNPDNELIRFRTRGGTQVIVHETSGYVYLNSKSGNSWIEISDEGVDIYSKKSVSVHAEEDLNFRSSRDVYIEGERGVFIRSGTTMTCEAGQDLSVKAGTDMKFGAGGLFQTRAGGALNLDAGGNLTMKAGGQMLRTASQLHDNGPSAASVEMPKVRAQGDLSHTQSDIPAGQTAALSSAVSSSAGSTIAKATKTVSSATAVASKATSVANDLSATAAPVAAKAKGFADQATKAANGLTKASADLKKASDRVHEESAKLTKVVTDTVTRVNQLQSQVKGRVDSLATAGTDQLNKAVSGAIGDKIGGRIGEQLNRQVSGTLNGVAAKATGRVTEVVGQASSRIASTGKIAADVQSTVANGVARVEQARTTLSNAMQGVQTAASKVNSAAKTAGKVASDVKKFASETPELTDAHKTALNGSATDLAAQANDTASSATDTVKKANSVQSMAAKKTTKKTIVQRMPSHEPWDWHPKEGQQSAPSVTPTEQKKADIAAAGARPGQSSANAVAKEVEVKKTVQTGTGSVVKTIKRNIGPVLKIGSALVQHDIISAVKEASTVTGVNSGYLMAKASEMGFNPHTVMADARGLMQITSTVYSDLAGRKGAQYGISTSDIHDVRSNVLMGAVMTKENATYLADKGLATGPTELNLAHLMGAPIATQFLTMRERNPTAAAYASVNEDFSRSHRSIFYNGDGSARSVSEVYDAFETRIAGKASSYQSDLKEIDPPVAVTPFSDGDFI